MKKVNILLCWLLFFLFLFLLYFCKPQVFPEISVFSYLVQNGQIPYRDFFDHHGFLLYYLLAPFIEPDYRKVQIVYFFFQALNFFLVKRILQKHTGEFGVVVGLVLFLIFGMFAVTNSLWYDSFILTFILASVYTDNPLVSGFLVGIATLIKPTAGLMVLPTIWNKRSWQCIVGFSIPVILGVLYLYSNQALPNAFEYLVKYNLFIGSIYAQLTHVSYKYLFYSILITVGIVISYKITKDKSFFFSYLICSFIFFPPQHDPVHAVVFMAFASIILAKLLDKYSKNKYLIFSLSTIIGILFLILVKKAIYFNQQTPWQENENIIEITEQISNYEDNYLFVILTERADLLLQSKTTRSNSFPIYLPFMETYFINYDKTILKTILTEEKTLILWDENFLTAKKFNYLENYLISKCTTKISRGPLHITDCSKTH